MTAREVLETVAEIPSEDWLEIQAALNEAETEFARGEAISIDEMRRHFGLQ